MKRYISCLFFILVVVLNSYAQQTRPIPELTRAEYLKKSKKQKANAVLLVVTGCTIGLVGGLLSAISASSNTGPSFPIIPVTIGVGCLAGSVALTKAATRNEKKALEASSYFYIRKIPSFNQTMGAPNYIGITPKVAISK